MTRRTNQDRTNLLNQAVATHLIDSWTCSPHDPQGPWHLTSSEGGETLTRRLDHQGLASLLRKWNLG